MSLLGSIFGSGSEKPGKQKKADLSGLFEKSSKLPERPHHVPFATPVKRKEAEDSGKDREDEELSEKKKKRKKPRKEKMEETGQEVKNAQGETVQEDSTENKNEDSEPKEEDQDRTIFVGNLPLTSTTRKSLAALFKDCGPIASTRIRGVPVKGVKLPPSRAGNQNLMKKVSVNTKQIDEESLKQSVQGYVVFKAADSIPKALKLNNTIVDGHRIRVDKASPTVDPSRSVFCGNLPYGADEASLQAHFEKGCDLDAGDVEGVRIVRDKTTYQCKGFGYVLLREKTMVPLALKLHESTYKNKQLRVLVCGKRFKGKQGANLPKHKSSSIAQADEKVTIGAFRRILAKQTKESVQSQKRKRGEKKKSATKATGAGTSGLSKRAALDKKVDKRVKKLQKRMSKGMGKTRK